MATMAPPPLKYRPCHNPDGLVSEEALRIIVEAKACFVALALALAYFLTASQHRLWSSSHLIKGFLFAVTQPVTRFLVGMFTMLLAMPFRNDLYLLWGILLLAGYEGVYTISGYCVSASRYDLAVHEFARGYNIIVLGLYVRYYSHASQFRYPLWALWALMVAKFLERVVRFKIAIDRYGDANTNFVADYMKHEDKIKMEERNENNPTMEGYNYLIVGDYSKMIRERVETRYEEKIMPPEESDDVVTVAKVWVCKAELLRSNTHCEELKDVCLSFALCNLLRRKFTGVAAADSEKPKAQKLVFDILLKSGWKRTFRVVRTELGFARDLMYTKYPILFSSGFPVVSTALFAVTLAVSVWITTSAVRHYRAPHGSTSNVVHGRNVDLLITFVILGMVTGMEICEFFIHLFSDWTKVMVISEYVQKPWLRRPRFISSVLKFICCGKIAEPIGSSLGQFDLVNAAEEKRRCLLPERIIRMYHVARSFALLTSDKDYRIKKCKTLGPVPDAVQKMICKTLLSNRQDLIRGQEHLTRRRELESYEKLKDQFVGVTKIETIMVWHVVTSTLAVAEGERSGDRGGSSPDYFVAATTLSKYCAYLVFYKPKLLPIASNSVRFMCNKLIEEANSEEKPDGGIFQRGLRVAEELRGCVPGGDGGGWEALAELWCEVLISMAPQGNIGAHQKELGKGGEFITHLWALLYHAGIDDKFSGSSTGAADGALLGRSDEHGQANNVCHAGSVV